MDTGIVKRIIILSALLLLFSTSVMAEIRFDADFEGGCLGEVTRKSKDVFVVGEKADPENIIDTDLAPSVNWYYWRVTGVKGQKITIKCTEQLLSGSSYSYDGKTWQHFSRNEIKKHSITKRFERDTCYVAPFVPYTYSYGKQRLDHWASREDVVRDTIGYSFQHRPLEVLHITDPDSPAEGKKRVWIHSRIHPSESPASYLLDAFLEELTDSSASSKAIREKFDFHILPFINPDGVANGYARCNALGVNQEINYDRCTDSTVVEIQAVKKELERLTEEKPLDLLLNNHSQRSPFATFWMHTAESTSQKFQGKLWTLTGLTCTFNPYMSTDRMSFSSVKPRYVEGFIWNRNGEDTPAITVETPYNYYGYGGDADEVTVENLGEIGHRLLWAVVDYFQVDTPGRYFIETPEKMPEGWETASDQFSCMGQDAWVSTRPRAEVNYFRGDLPSGRYTIYRYVSGENISPEKGSFFSKDEYPGLHGWVRAGSCFILPGEMIEYRLRAYQAGETADALMVIKEQ